MGFSDPLKLPRFYKILYATWQQVVASLYLPLSTASDKQLGLGKHSVPGEMGGWGDLTGRLILASLY